MKAGLIAGSCRSLVAVRVLFCLLALFCMGSSVSYASIVGVRDTEADRHDWMGDSWLTTITNKCLQFELPGSVKHVDPAAEWSGSIDVTDIFAGTWKTFQAADLYEPDIWGDAGTIDDFLSRLDSRDWIGVNVMREGIGTEPESRRLDNTALIIPEPPELLMLVMVLAAGLVFYRRRKPEHIRS